MDGSVGWSPCFHLRICRHLEGDPISFLDLGKMLLDLGSYGSRHLVTGFRFVSRVGTTVLSGYVFFHGRYVRCFWDFFLSLVQVCTKNKGVRTYAILVLSSLFEGTYVRTLAPA